MKLSTTLKGMSATAAAYSVISLALVIFGYDLFWALNPFVALLLLVASPFFYFMGYAARTNELIRS